MKGYWRLIHGIEYTEAFLSMHPPVLDFFQVREKGGRRVARKRKDPIMQLYQAAKAGRTEEVLPLQQKVYSLAKMWEVGGATDASYFNSMKTALQLFGVCGPDVSRPYAPFGEAEVAQVRAILQEHGLL